MKITLWGVQCSIQTSGPETNNYGSRTSCAFVSEDDQVPILDAGTGMQQFNSISFSRKRIDVLLTHHPVDHILGLGFFSPFFDAKMEAHICGERVIRACRRGL